MSYVQNIPPQIIDAANWCTQNVLRRVDIQNEANQHAVDFYTVLCGKVPFDALQFVTTELPFTAGTDTYDLKAIFASNSFPVLNGIMSVRATFAPGVRRRLRRTNTRVYDALSILNNSFPATYARFGTTLTFNPPPDSSTYTYRIRYWTTPTLLADGQGGVTTPIVIPIEWLELMKWTTLDMLYQGELQMPDRSAALWTQPLFTRGQPTTKKLLVAETGLLPRLWNDLLTTISQKENVDEDFAINPVIRAYSVRPY